MRQDASLNQYRTKPRSFVVPLIVLLAFASIVILAVILAGPDELPMQLPDRGTPLFQPFP